MKSINSKNAEYDHSKANPLLLDVLSDYASDMRDYVVECKQDYDAWPPMIVVSDVNDERLSELLVNDDELDVDWDTYWTLFDQENVLITTGEGVYADPL